MPVGFLALNLGNAIGISYTCMNMYNMQGDKVVGLVWSFFVLYYCVKLCIGDKCMLIVGIAWFCYIPLL